MLQLDRVGKDNQTQLRCGFWEADAQVWSTDGCSITSDNQTGVVCTCNHLTDFAVLVVSVENHGKNALHWGNYKIQE